MDVGERTHGAFLIFMTLNAKTTKFIEERNAVYISRLKMYFVFVQNIIQKSIVSCSSIVSIESCVFPHNEHMLCSCEHDNKSTLYQYELVVCVFRMTELEALVLLVSIPRVYSCDNLNFPHQKPL